MALPKLDITRHELTIPSTGQKALYRPFTVKEQKILMLAQSSDDKQEMIEAAKALIAACTFDEIDTSELTMFDFEYIFLKIRTKSVGETADVIMTCTNCSKQNDIELDLETAKVENLESLSDNKISLTDKIGMILKYPTIDSVGASANDTDSEFDSLLISMIDCIYDEDQVYPASESTPEELLDFINSFSVKHIEKANDFIRAMPAVAIEGNFKCVGCSHDNKYNIKGLQNFF